MSATDVRTESCNSSFTHRELQLSVLTSQVAQAHYERSAYISLFFFAYIMSRQNIRVCMGNATKRAL